MAETEMVERVARAISIDLGEDPDAPDVLIRGRPGTRPHWEGYESTALAAITAMREPTEEMRQAGIHEHALTADPDDIDQVSGPYSAMISAALSPKE